MNPRHPSFRIAIVLLLFITSAFVDSSAAAANDAVVILPDGIKAVWDIEKAWKETTPTRQRICINGLWRWQPAASGEAAQVSEGDWGFFKVPGCWPGITDYMQKDCQTVFAHPSWKGQRLGNISSAWYQREFTVPAD